MKNIALLTLILFVGPRAPQRSDDTSNLQSSARATTGPLRFEVGERGANHKVWSKITEDTDAEGRIVLTTNQAFVELATGQNCWEDGQWKEGRVEFEVTRQSDAIACNGQYKVAISSVLKDVNGMSSAGYWQRRELLYARSWPIWFTCMRKVGAFGQSV